MVMHTVVTTDEETGDIVVGEQEATPVEKGVVGHNENLAMNIDSGKLAEIGAYITEKADADKSSRTEWEEQNARAMKLQGIGPESDPDDIEYDSANTSDHPLLLSALTRFQSSALSELLPPEKVCTGVSAFDLSGLDKKQRGEAERDIEKAIKRVEAYYLDYLGQKLPSYEEDTDLILRDCGLMGVGIRKIYVDPTIKSAPVRADYVPLEDLFIAYDAKSTREGRITHRIRMDASDLVRYMVHGIYRAVDIVGGETAAKDAVTEQRDIIQGITDRHLSGGGKPVLYETHANLFLEHDPHPRGLSRPYIVTVAHGNGAVLSIRRNWVDGDPDERRIEQFVAYPYHPGKSAIFALGLGALLANQTEALRDGQRAGLDAAYLANHPAGFKKSTMSIREDNTRVLPGEFVDVDSPGAGPIQDMLMLHPFQGPDQGLMSLMDRMEANGKELGGVATADLAGMMGPSVAPGPALAAYDEQTKFQSAVHRRLYRAHKCELRLIHQRHREIYANKTVPFGVNSALQPTDLVLVDLLPAMDPSQISRARRMMEAQVKLDTATANPDVMDKRAALIDFLNAIGTTDIEHLLIPEPQEARPADAVTEYGNAMKNMPIVAGPAQNHAAHIDAHLASLKGLQSSPLAPEDGERVMAAMAAHIVEHFALDLAVQVAAAMGVSLADFAEGIPPEIEYQIAPMLAQAIQQVEQMRASPTDNDIKLQIEQLRAENKLAVEQIRTNASLAKEAMESQQKRGSDATSTLNNREDNATALLIAGLKGTSVPRTDQPVTAPSQNMSPDPSRSARS